MSIFILRVVCGLLILLAFRRNSMVGLGCRIEGRRVGGRPYTVRSRGCGSSGSRMRALMLVLALRSVFFLLLLLIDVKGLRGNTGAGSTKQSRPQFSLDARHPSRSASLIE